MTERFGNLVLLFAAFAAIGCAGSYALSRVLTRARAFQPYREWGPEHKTKGDIPTGGGVVFLVGILIFWIYSLFNRGPTHSGDWGGGAIFAVSVICAGVLAAGLIGLADDLLKLKSRTSLGLPARYKFALQLLLGAVTTYLLASEGSHLKTPLNEAFREPSFLLFSILGAIAFAAIVNGVNFTDGLDGLAAGSVTITLLGVMVLSGVFSMPGFMPLSAAGMGLVSGFLFLNLRPARIFMGDTGSYALGALVALILTGSGLLLFSALLGVVYLLEMISVILQVSGFRLYGKRLFLMSPLHHHFEKKGYSEDTIVAGFWMLQAAGTFAAVIAARP